MAKSKKHQVDEVELRKATAAWIRADWAFRLGPCAYSNGVTDPYIAAQERLRKALTGKRFLYNAAARLGCPVDVPKTPPEYIRKYRH